MAFVKAVKTGNKLRMALTGPAGSGKTYTALAIATALGGRVAVLDTEHGSASKYADLFDFDTATPDSFSIDNYISTIREAEVAGYDILIIDSLSHAWAGRDGALEEVDRLKRASRSGDAFTQGWSQVTPKQNKLIDAILASKMHIIATMRAKMAYEKTEGSKDVKRLGLAPVQREGVEYEFDVVGEIDIDHVMRITKTRCIALTDKAFDKPGADVARILKTWLDSAAAPALPPPAPEPPKSARPDLDRVRALFAALHVSPERQAKTLGEMGCERVEELTTTQAAQLIERMDKALKAKNAEAAPATTAA